MISKKRQVFIGILILFVIATCDNRSSNGDGQFDVYGRIVCVPYVTESSFAEFYLFHSGLPVIDGEIVVDSFSVPLVNEERGRYRLDFDFGLGDTLEYNVVSEFGSQQGMVIIPDTASIIRPQPQDTIPTGFDYTAIWQRKTGVAGYFAYLENQGGYANALTDTEIDTSADFSGDNIFNPGNDRFWVETLNGFFINDITPDGMNLPRGVVGAAGNFKDVYVGFAR